MAGSRALQHLSFVKLECIFNDALIFIMLHLKIKLETKSNLEEMELVGNVDSEDKLESHPVDK